MPLNCTWSVQYIPEPTFDVSPKSTLLGAPFWEAIMWTPKIQSLPNVVGSWRSPVSLKSLAPLGTFYHIPKFPYQFGPCEFGLVLGSVCGPPWTLNWTTLFHSVPIPTHQNLWGHNLVAFSVLLTKVTATMFRQKCPRYWPKQLPWPLTICKGPRSHTMMMTSWSHALLVICIVKRAGASQEIHVCLLPKQIVGRDREEEEEETSSI